MPVDKRIELEIALRDSASMTLKAIAQNLEDINRGLAKAGGEKAGGGEDPFKKIKETSESVKKTTEEGAKTVTGLAEGMMPLAANLLKGAALRGLLYAEVVKWGVQLVSGQAQERLDWMRMSEDTGLSKGFLSMMVQAQKKAGIEEPQAKSNILTLMSGLQGMSYGHGSPLAQRLSWIGEAVFARELTELMMAGKRDEAVQAAIQKGEDKFKEGDVKGRAYADAFNLQPTFFQKLRHLLTTVKPAEEMSAEASIEFHERMLRVMQWYNNAITSAQNFGVRFLNDIFSKRFWSNDWATQFHPSQYEDYGLLPGVLLPAEKMKAWQERNKTTADVLREILSTYQTHENVRSIERKYGGSVLPGRKYLVGEEGPELFRSASGMQGIIEGPDIFSSDTPGEIIPNSRMWEQMHRFGDWQQNAFGKTTPMAPGGMPDDWDNWRMSDQGILTARPSLPPGGSPEENWEHLNRALTGPWGSGVGIAEGQPLNAEGPDVWDFKQHERQMEERLQLPWYGRDGAWPAPLEQPASFRNLMDRELGGGGSGSLGAEIIFKNVPEGVDTDADGEGFDSFTVNKTRQLQGA